MHIVFGYVSRLSWKKLIRRYGIGEENKKSMLVVTTSATAEQILDRLSDERLTGYRITEVVLTDNKGENPLEAILLLLRLKMQQIISSENGSIRFILMLPLPMRIL